VAQPELGVPALPVSLRPSLASTQRASHAWLPPPRVFLRAVLQVQRSFPELEDLHVNQTVLVRPLVQGAARAAKPNKRYPALPERPAQNRRVTQVRPCPGAHP
jgi:hypothetical protein